MYCCFGSVYVKNEKNPNYSKIKYLHSFNQHHFRGTDHAPLQIKMNVCIYWLGVQHLINKLCFMYMDLCHKGGVVGDPGQTHTALIYCVCVWTVLNNMSVFSVTDWKNNLSHVQREPEVHLSVCVSCLRQARKECVSSSLLRWDETIRLGLKKGTPSWYTPSCDCFWVFQQN